MVVDTIDNNNNFIKIEYTWLYSAEAKSGPQVVRAEARQMCELYMITSV